MPSMPGQKQIVSLIKKTLKYPENESTVGQSEAWA